VNRINTHAFPRARERAGIPEVRVHDLRHTFGHRLRAAGVSFEDRQDLLGHKSDRMTTHYSSPDLARLIEVANRICQRRPSTVLRVAARATSVTSPETPREGRRINLNTGFPSEHFDVVAGASKEVPQNSRKGSPAKEQWPGGCLVTD
jgi:hypothetical protein